MKTRNTSCSFCRKSHEHVGPLVEGPGGVYICAECVPLCQSIIDQERRRRKIGSAVPAASRQSVREKLDKLVSAQDYAKSVLVEAAFQRSEGRGRVLLIGSSPSSQLFLAKALAHALEVPFAAGSSGGLATTGSGNPFVELLMASDFDVDSAQRGVVYVPGVEQADVQDALVRLWQTNVIEPVAGLPLHVRGILFICGGTFTGLNEAVNRLGRHPEQPLTPESLIGVGVRPDLVGYAIAHVVPLDEDNLARIVHLVDFDRMDEGTDVTESPE